MPARPIPRHRRAVVAVVAGAVSATALAASGPVAQAVEVTRSVTFVDCETRRAPYTTNVKVLDDITWSTSMRVQHPTPIPAREEVTYEVELGALPAGILPENLTEVYLDSYVELSNGVTGPLVFSGADHYVASYDASAPLPLPEIENDAAWPDAGLFPQRPKKVSFLFTGTDGGGEFAEYSFECDLAIAAPSLFTLAVYDLSATATASTDRFTARQGQAIRVTGRNLLSTAPTNPPGRASVRIAGLVVATVPIDASGAINAVVQVPPFAAPGRRVVQIAHSGKGATVVLTVVAAAAKVKVTPRKARAGKKLTLRGSSFRPGEKVRITLKGGRGAGKKAFAVSAKASATGAIRASVRLRKAARGGWKTVATGITSGRTGRSSFKVR